MFTLYSFFFFILIMFLGIIIIILSDNLLKKLLGLNIFQYSVFILYISLANVRGARAPILSSYGGGAYSMPLLQVLILTAIVVSISSTVLGYALVIRIAQSYKTIDEKEILKKNLEKK